MSDDRTPMTLDELTTDIVDWFDGWRDSDVPYDWDYVTNVDWAKDGPEVIVGVTFETGRYFQIVISEP